MRAEKSLGVTMGPASPFPELPLRTIELSLRENENASQADVNASVSVACWAPSGKRILQVPRGGCVITLVHILRRP